LFDAPSKARFEFLQGSFVGILSDCLVLCSGHDIDFSLLSYKDCEKAMSHSFHLQKNERAGDTANFPA
jgi:hypothetical protein